MKHSGRRIYLEKIWKPGLVVEIELYETFKIIQINHDKLMAFSSSQPWSQLMRSKWLVAPGAHFFMYHIRQEVIHIWHAWSIDEYQILSPGTCLDAVSSGSVELELTISRHNFWQGNHFAYRTTRSLRCGSYRPLNSVKFPVFLLNKKMSCVFASYFKQIRLGKAHPKAWSNNSPVRLGLASPLFGWPAGAAPDMNTGAARHILLVSKK